MLSEDRRRSFSDPGSGRSARTTPSKDKDVFHQSTGPLASAFRAACPRQRPGKSLPRINKLRQWQQDSSQPMDD